jgi:hypothetical protein
MCFIYGCSSERSYTPSLEQAMAGGIGGDPIRLKKLVEELDRQNVPFTRMKTDTGKVFVTYRIKDIAAFRKVYRLVYHGEELNSRFHESTTVSSEFEKELLKTKLRESKIPFQESLDDGLMYILWSQTYGPAVDYILQEVAEENFKYKAAIKKDSQPESIVSGYRG